LEQLAEDMGGSSDPTRRHGELAGIGLGIGDKLGNGLGRNRRIYLEDTGCTDEAGDRQDVAAEIETKLFVYRSIDRVCRSDEEQCVTIRRRAHDRLGRDIGGSTRPVFDDEWLSQPLRQPLSDQACDDVGRPASGKADDDAHRSRGMVLRSGEAREDREGGGARCEMEKFWGGNFYGRPSSLIAFVARAKMGGGARCERG